MNTDPSLTERPETPRESLERRRDQETVYRALEQLAPKKRIVLYLHEIEGLDLKEIAYLVDSNPSRADAPVLRTREFYKLLAVQHARLRRGRRGVAEWSVRHVRPPAGPTRSRSLGEHELRTIERRSATSACKLRVRGARASALHTIKNAAPPSCRGLGPRPHPFVGRRSARAHQGVPAPSAARPLALARRRDRLRFAPIRARHPRHSSPSPPPRRRASPLRRRRRVANRLAPRDREVMIDASARPICSRVASSPQRVRPTMAASTCSRRGQRVRSRTALESTERFDASLSSRRRVTVDIESRRAHEAKPSSCVPAPHLSSCARHQFRVQHDETTTTVACRHGSRRRMRRPAFWAAAAWRVAVPPHPEASPLSATSTISRRPPHDLRCEPRSAAKAFPLESPPSAAARARAVVELGPRDAVRVLVGATPSRPPISGRSAAPLVASRATPASRLASRSRRAPPTLTSRPSPPAHDRIDHAHRVCVRGIANSSPSRTYVAIESPSTPGAINFLK